MGVLPNFFASLRSTLSTENGGFSEYLGGSVQTNRQLVSITVGSDKNYKISA